MHFNKKKLATNLVRKKKYTTKIVALESFLKICPHETEEDANANDPEEGKEEDARRAWLEAVAAEEMPAKKKEKDRAKAEAQAAYTIDEEVEEND
jgi:hypothetical protein